MSQKKLAIQSSSVRVSIEWSCPDTIESRVRLAILVFDAKKAAVDAGYHRCPMGKEQAIVLEKHFQDPLGRDQFLHRERATLQLSKLRPEAQAVLCVLIAEGGTFKDHSHLEFKLHGPPTQETLTKFNPADDKFQGPHSALILVSLEKSAAGSWLLSPLLARTAPQAFIGIIDTLAKKRNRVNSNPSKAPPSSGTITPPQAPTQLPPTRSNTNAAKELSAASKVPVHEKTASPSSGRSTYFIDTKPEMSDEHSVSDSRSDMATSSSSSDEEVVTELADEKKAGTREDTQDEQGAAHGQRIQAALAASRKAQQEREEAKRHQDVAMAKTALQRLNKLDRFLDHTQNSCDILHQYCVESAQNTLEPYKAMLEDMHTFSTTQHTDVMGDLEKGNSRLRGIGKLLLLHSLQSLGKSHATMLNSLDLDEIRKNIHSPDPGTEASSSRQVPIQSEHSTPGHFHSDFRWVVEDLTCEKSVPHPHPHEIPLTELSNVFPRGFPRTSMKDVVARHAQPLAWLFKRYSGEGTKEDNSMLCGDAIFESIDKMEDSKVLEWIEEKWALKSIRLSYPQFKSLISAARIPVLGSLAAFWVESLPIAESLSRPLESSWSPMWQYSVDSTINYPNFVWILQTLASEVYSSASWGASEEHLLSCLIQAYLLPHKSYLEVGEPIPRFTASSAMAQEGELPFPFDLYEPDLHQAFAAFSDKSCSDDGTHGFKTVNISSEKMVECIRYHWSGLDRDSVLSAVGKVAQFQGMSSKGLYFASFLDVLEVLALQWSIQTNTLPFQHAHQENTMDITSRLIQVFLQQGFRDKMQLCL